MRKQKTSKDNLKSKGRISRIPSIFDENHGILAKHRIKVLKIAGISKSKDYKKTVTVVNPTSDLEKGGTEETGW